MKKLALIGSYCHTEKQFQTLETTLKEWKKLGVDTMVLSPLHLPSYIIEMCDYYFYTKENPILHWPIRAHAFYYNINGITLAKTLSDYGWARLYQMKKLAEIASTFDYEIFYQTEYDLLIDDYVKNYVNNNTENLITRRIDPKGNGTQFFDASLHFISLDKENLNKVKDSITLEKYLQDVNTMAEDHAIMWSEQFNIPIDKQGYVVDLINHFDQYQFNNHTLPNFFFNESISEDYKIFFENKNEPNNTFKFVVYEIKGKEINIKVNGTEFPSVKEWKVYDTGILVNRLQSISVNGDEYVELVKKLYRNSIKVL